MAKRKLFRETPREQTIQRHQGSVQAGIQMTGQAAWVDTMAQAHAHISNYLDREAVNEGKKAGLKAAKEGKFKETGNANLYDNAFDTAGREGYKSQMATQMATSMSDIYEENKHDPKVLQEKLDKYRSSMIADAEKTSPEVALELDAAANRQMMGYAKTSRSMAENALAASTEASANMNITAIQSRALWGVKNLDDRNLAMQSVAAERANLEKFLIQNGPKEAFFDPSEKLPKGGIHYLSENSQKAASASSGDRTGVYTGKQIQLALKDFDDKTVHEQYMYGMHKAMESDKGSDYIRNFIDHPDPTLRPDQADAIETSMWQELSKKTKIANAQTKAEKAAQELVYKQTDAEFTAMALKGELTTENITNALDRDEITGTTARTLGKMIKGGGPEHSDGMALMMYQNFGLLESTPEEIMADNRLTYTDRTSLIKERQKQVDNQDNWMNSPSGNDGSRRIKIALGIADGIMIPGMSQELIKKAGEAESRYVDEVNKLPIEKRRHSAIEISQRIVKEIQTEEKKTELNNRKEYMAALPYRTVEELDADYEPGDVVEFTDPKDMKQTYTYKYYKSYILKKQRAIEQLEREVSGK